MSHSPKLPSTTTTNPKVKMTNPIIAFIAIALIENICLFFFLPYPYRYGITLYKRKTEKIDPNTFIKEAPLHGVKIRKTNRTGEMWIRDKIQTGMYRPLVVGYSIKNTNGKAVIKAKTSAYLLLGITAIAIAFFENTSSIELALLAVGSVLVLCYSVLRSTMEIKKFIDALNKAK